MYTAITVIMILLCVLLILVVLIQNPKGGGLSATFGGIGNQLMGAKQSTDVMERTTWTMAIALLALSLLSAFFVPEPTYDQTIPKSEVEDLIYDFDINPGFQDMNTGGQQPQQQPSTTPEGN